MLEKFYLNDKKILDKAISFFYNSNIAPIIKIGVELEFYLLRQNQPASVEEVEDFIAEIKNCPLSLRGTETQRDALRLAGISIPYVNGTYGKNFAIVEKERGASQIEIKTDFTHDLQALCAYIEEAKSKIKNLAETKNLSASFAAQPFANDCGNALQFNISLHNNNHENLFFSDKKLLENCIDSILSATNLMMIFLAPQPQDYQRFSREININLFKNAKFTAPVNLSFGFDNRSCAIRIKENKSSKRLEFRIASASANPYLAISAIIISLTQKSPKNFTAIFGNAFDEKYQLEEFYKNHDEALRTLDLDSNFIVKKFNEFLL